MDKLRLVMRGGKRPGAGRPKGEPTRKIGIRVPEKWHEEIILLIREYIKKKQDL